MILYLDTSLLISALTNEVATPRIKPWLAAQPEDRLAISDWVKTEVSSALSIKLRSGKIDLAGRAAALSRFRRQSQEVFRILDMPSGCFDEAARFADRESLGLRGGDALHLAICARHGATLCTLDQRQAAAGPALGVGTQLV